jgi:methanethiol S-methyltransferase
MRGRVFVWSGGVLFVLSLAACAYSYLVAWSSPATSGAGWPFGAAGAVAVDAALFAGFAAHHSLFARDAMKNRLSRIVPDHLLRSVYVWAASLLLLAVLALWHRIDGDVYRVTGWRAVVHAAVQIAGVWLIARSVARIDALELAGIRTAAPRSSEPTDLQIAGPYRWVRHPLYLGWVLAVFGAAHMSADRLAFAVITTGYLVLAVPWEERSLRRTFGAQYEQYERAVRWRIVPYVY